MLKFTKMQGTGNDFIIIDSLNQQIEAEYIKKNSQVLCDRHFGIGADGVVWIEKSETADFKMRIFNADGSEAEMCGNGIRCFAWYIFLQSYISKNIFSVETLAGIKIPEIISSEGNRGMVKIDMGEPFLKPEAIPFLAKETVNVALMAKGQDFLVSAVGMGNPHAVIFVGNVADFPLSVYGPSLETNSLFPNKTNVEIIEIIDRKHIKMRVWERGSGETLACGTGACASVVAGIIQDKLDSRVNVSLLGGELNIEWQDKKHVFMTGPAVNVFSGEINV